MAEKKDERQNDVLSAAYYGSLPGREAIDPEHLPALEEAIRKGLIESVTQFQLTEAGHRALDEARHG